MRPGTIRGHDVVLIHNRSMEWQATDQFGNLYVGDSEAHCLEELRTDLAMLVNEVRVRAGDSFQITIDFDYKEISGPEPERVTHILRVPWIATQLPDEILAGVTTIVTEICAINGLEGIIVGRA